MDAGQGGDDAVESVARLVDGLVGGLVSDTGVEVQSRHLHQPILSDVERQGGLILAPLGERAQRPVLVGPGLVVKWREKGRQSAQAGEGPASRVPIPLSPPSCGESVPDSFTPGGSAVKEAIRFKVLWVNDLLCFSADSGSAILHASPVPNHRTRMTPPGWGCAGSCHFRAGSRTAEWERLATEEGERSGPRQIAHPLHTEENRRPGDPSDISVNAYQCLSY